MTRSEDQMAYLPDERIAAVLHNSGISAQIDSIQNAVKRFDETTHAAAESIREGEKRLDEAMFTARRR